MEDNKMFANIGGKIKGLAVGICILGIAASVIAGLGLMTAGSAESIGVGFAILVGGSLLSWIGSFFAYGFGELIENTTVIAELAAKADAEKNKEE